MKERIIFAPGAKGTELLRMLARFGTNTLGTRVLNATGLAQTALMRAGASFTELYLPPEDGPALLSSFLNTIPYFEKASFADAEKLFAERAPIYAQAPFVVDTDGLTPAEVADAILGLLPGRVLP